MAPQKNSDVLVVTGCDESHFHLAEDFIASFRHYYGDAFDLAFINFGTQTPPPSIATYISKYIQVPQDPAFSKDIGLFVSYDCTKAKTRDYFPGYKIYIWIDADCWFQNAESLSRIIMQAQHHELAIHPEYDTHYFARHLAISERTVKIYTQNEAEHLHNMPLYMPTLNAGVIGMRHDSRVWALWQQEIAALHVKHAQGRDVFFCDQVALHKVIYLNAIHVGILRAIDNWQAHACLPQINLTTKKLIVPSPPYEEISLMHLAGPAKYQTMQMNGHKFGLRYRDVQNLMQQTF